MGCIILKTIQQFKAKDYIKKNKKKQHSFELDNQTKWTFPHNNQHIPPATNY